MSLDPISTLLAARIAGWYPRNPIAICWAATKQRTLAFRTLATLPSW
jgi:hypothetical protein